MSADRALGVRLPQSALAAIMAAFLAISVTYGLMNPLFEAPDELWHFLYVEHLKTRRDLPVATADLPVLSARQEATQPPLYYALAALVTATIDSGDLAPSLQFNPSYDPSRRNDPGARSFLVHTEKESSAISQFARAAHLDRVLSTLFGAGTVFFTYLLGRLVFPARPLVAVGGAAITAFNPQFVFLSASINNDSAVTFLSSLSLFLLARLLSGGSSPPGRVWLLLLATTTGLAAVSKLSGIGLAALCIVCLVYLRASGRWQRGLASALLVYTAGFTAVAGWWYVRNLLLYGEPLGVRPMIELVGSESSMLAAFGKAGEVFASYWASFGWSTILVDAWIYAVFAGFCLLSGAGLLRPMTRGGTYRRMGEALGPLLLVAWAATMLALLIRWMISLEAPQGRLLFPAISANSLLLSWGIASLWHRGRALLVSAFSLSLLGAAVASLSLYIVPAYPIWPLYPAAAAPAPTHESRAVFGDGVELRGLTAREQEVEPGGSLSVDLLWSVTRQVDRRLTGYAHLVARASQQKIGSAPDLLLGRDGFPLAWWKPGDVMRDVRSVQVVQNARAPMIADLVVGLYETDTGTPVAGVDGRGNAVREVAPLRVRVLSRLEPDLRGTRSSAHTFGDELALVAFAYPERVFRDAGDLSGRLIWKAARRLERDLTVFVHLMDRGVPISQYDAQPLGGHYPTSAWRAGETIPDTFAVPIRDLPTGRYTLQAGLYELGSGKRLRAGEMDAVTLGSVEVSGN